MSKGKGNETTVQRTPTGQYHVTIPKAIAGMLEIEKGNKFEWIYHPEGLLLKKIQRDLNAKDK